MSSVTDNPRYVIWARAHGRTPAAQLEQDRRDWPGGSMCGFTLWNREQLRAAPAEFFCYGGLVDHDGYDQWLLERFP